MASVYQNHSCSGDSESCIYCLSHLQQTYQVAKLFVSSSWNRHDHSNNNLYCYETSMTLHQRATVAAIPITIAISNKLPEMNFGNKIQSSKPKQSKSITNKVHVRPSDKQESTSNTSNTRKHGYTRCQCPNCSVEGGNKTRGPNGKPLHLCHIADCGKFFSNSTYLKVHLKKHCGLKTFFCAYCGEGYKIKGDLVKHIKSHMPEKYRYTCSIPNCDRAFYRLCHLKVHLNWHMGKKNFSAARCKCPNCNVEGGNKTRGLDGKLQHVCHIPHCGRIFNQAGNLKIHLNWHAGKTKFVCRLCDKGFLYISNLKKHINNIHANAKLSGVENDSADIDLIAEDIQSSEIAVQTSVDNIRPQLACRIAGCGKIYYYANHLSAHLKKDHGVKPHICTWPSCDRSFTYPSQLQTHLKNHRAMEI